MIVRLLRLHDAGMMAAARGRLTSTRWRVALGVAYAMGVSLVLNSYWIGFGWLVPLWSSIAIDHYIGARYLGAAEARTREIYGLAFAFLSAVSISIFAAMTMYVGIVGGAEGRVLSVLMAASSLISVMIFLFQAPAFMLVTAVPCGLCLALLPLFPISPSPASPIAGALGVAFGTGLLLIYVVRSALLNSKMFKNLEDATATALRRHHEAEAASRAKSEFFATITHELRTPLNAVIGYAEIIEEDMVAENRTTVADDAGRITKAARHLLGLIDQILQVTKIQSELTSEEVSDTDVRALIEEVIGAIAAGATDRGDKIHMRIANDISTVSTDREKLKACIANLMSNAVKFTQNGDIVVSADREISGDTGWLRIAVADTGVGMTPEQIKLAFEAFTQVDGTATRSVGGLGLGLSIASRCAHALGGDITVTSAPGVGSTFTLRTPMRVEVGPVQQVRSDAA